MIDDEEAAKIRALYNLYRRHQAIRKVKECADDLWLWSRVRQGSDGNIVGGQLFSRGHVYYILTNPIYTGRNRH